MHSSSLQMVKESKNLCQPSGASSKSGEELSLVNSIAQMVTIGAAPGVPRWPDPNGHHELTDGVYNLLGNALWTLQSRAGSFRGGRTASVTTDFLRWAPCEQEWARLLRFAADFASPLPCSKC